MSQTRPRAGSDARRQRRDGRRARAKDGPERPQTPELISLGISAAIVLGLVGALVYVQLTMSDKPALIEARPILEEVAQEGELFHLPVEIANRGGKAGEEVTVRLAVIRADGARQVAELTIGFLAAGEMAEATLALSRDPRGSRIEIEAIGYLEPG